MTSVSPDSSSTPETATLRGAPWSNEAEQAVLGAMLLDNDAALDPNVPQQLSAINIFSGRMVRKYHESRK